MTEAKNDEGHKVFVGNLSYDTTENDLVNLFKNFNVVDAEIVKRNDRSKGFGFVRVKDESDIQKAVAALHDSTLEGRPINVEHAKPLAERPARVPKERKPRRETREPRETVEGEEASEKPKKKRRPKKKPAALVTDEENQDENARPAPRAKNSRSRPSRPKGEPSKTTVFVTNLCFKATEDELGSHFADFKPIRIHIVRNKSGKAQGVAFVEFETEQYRDSAIEKLNKVELNDRSLLLKIATAERPKTEDAAAESQ